MAAKPESAVLCLIVCGETAWSREGRLAGSTDLPLSDAGRSSVTADFERLAGTRAKFVHHPPDEAATETAGIFASRFGVKKKPLTALADPGLGLLEGMTQGQLDQRYPKRAKQWREDPLQLSPPQDEPVLAARGRIFNALASILSRTRGREAAVVLHPLGAGLLRCWLADRPSSRMWAMLQTRPRIERYGVTAETIALLREEAAEAMAESA